MKGVSKVRPMQETESVRDTVAKGKNDKVECSRFRVRGRFLVVRVGGGRRVLVSGWCALWCFTRWRAGSGCCATGSTDANAADSACFAEDSVSW